MNYFKKLLSVFLTAMIAVTIAGCGTKSPTKVVSESLDLIKSGKSTELYNLLNDEISSGEQNDDSTASYDESTKKLAESVKNITYKVNSETIEGDTAKVNVTLTGPDLADVFSQFLQKMFAEAFSQAFSGQTLSEEETNAKYDHMLSELLDGMKVTERTMDINLVKENNEWSIKDKNDLIKLVLNIDPSAFDDSSDLSTNTTTQSETSSKKETSVKKGAAEMTLNVPFTVETKYGNYNVTIEGVRLTDERNEYSEISANKVVFLDYNYENISYESDSSMDLYISEYDFQVLDDEGNVLDTYPVTDYNRVPKEAPVGGKSKGTGTYAITTDSKNINVTLKDGSTKVGNIIIPIQ